jgi:hypothetical protein
MRARVELPPFLPDVLASEKMLSVAENLLPAVGGYRAVPDFASVSEALPAAYQGGASFVASDAATYLLAGTATTLSKLGSGAWTSLLTGLTIAGRWRFAQFGDYAIAVNGDVTQEVDLQAGTAAALTDAPTGTSIAVVGDFVVIGQPDGDIIRVAWSAFNDHTGWTLGVDQAGDQPMLTGGEVMGLAGGEYGIILQRGRIVRMTRTGDEDEPFQFDEISDNFGCASKASVVQAGRTVFYLSDRGFMALDAGQAPRPIGNEKFDRTFKANLSPDDYERLQAAVDPENSLVMWGVPGSPGVIWVYNWALDRAGTIKFAFEGIFAGFESSVTLEGLDALYPSGIDSIPYSLDDPRFSGGAPRLYFVRGGEIGTLAGDMLAAKLSLGQFAPAGDKVLRIRALWPETDASSGVTVRTRVTQRRGDTHVQESSGALQHSGRVPLRTTGRFVEVDIEIAAGTDWSFINAFDIEGEPGGWRTV